jgi:hypothetical protein
MTHAHRDDFKGATGSIDFAMRVLRDPAFDVGLRFGNRRG